MPQTTTVSISIDEDVKQEAEKLFNALGLNLSAAVNMFLRQAIMEDAIPFQPRRKRKHIPLSERLKDFNGEYVFEEWDTGLAVGSEIIT